MNFDIMMAVNACLNSVSGFLNSPITGWFPVAFAGVTVIAFIMSIVYMLSPLIGRTELRSWARLKVFDSFFAFLLVVIFGGFASMLCTVSPVIPYNQIGLIPNVCNPAMHPELSGVITNIYALSECELFNFNSNIVNLMNNMVGTFSILTSSQPTISVVQNFVPGVSNFALAFQISLSPINIDTFFKGAASALGGLILLSQVQLVLLDASLVIFAILLPIGLLSRIFGVTKSFGGAMIAFALGIGVIFPLIITITYGFLGITVDAFSTGIGVVSAFNFNYNFLNNVAQQAACTANCAPVIGGTIFDLLTSPIAGIWGVFWTFIAYIGIAVVGTLILPIITFTIINTFILDFSQAIGEKMDFLSLMTKVV